MIKITCPNCGAEYLAAELFYPNEVFGNPGRIDKDAKGKIQFFTGSDMNLQETYTCDYCKRKMKLQIAIDFKVFVQPMLSNHVTNFNKSNLTLDES